LIVFSVSPISKALLHWVFIRKQGDSCKDCFRKSQTR